MSARPKEMQFSFVANNATPDDKSGKAYWVVPVWCRGQWNMETLDVAFSTFKAAHRMDSILSAVWNAGVAQGHADCERQVLSALSKCDA